MWRRGSPPRGKLSAFKQPERRAETVMHSGPPAEPASIILGRLLAATHDLQAQVERTPLLSRLSAADLSRNEYVSALRFLHAFYVGIEPAIAAALEDMPSAASMLDGSRARALAEDLEWFGVRPITPPRLSSLQGAAAALGALYAVEASVLGAPLMAQRLALSLGVTEDRGGTFYARHHAETSRRWRRLAACLEAPGLQPEAPIDGAVMIFRCLALWLRSGALDLDVALRADDRELRAPRQGRG